MTELDELRSALARLRDHEQIEGLHTAYAAMLDAEDYEALMRLLSDDALLEGMPGGPVRGAEAIATQLRDISVRHLASHRTFSNFRIAVQGNSALTVASFRSVHLDEAGDAVPDEHAHEGWYLTQLRKTSGQWRFTHLRRINLTEALKTSREGRARARAIYRAVPVNDRDT